jgi:hypothetical protein
MSIIDHTNSTWNLRRRLEFAPTTTFDATAVRARAGLLNIVLGATIALTALRPELGAASLVMPILALDMFAAVLFGPTPLSPTGVLATFLTRAIPAVPTPHMPKRFAWSLGGMLAVTCIVLAQGSVGEIALLGTLGVFFVLTWLDAALGFCVGCWIYSKSFGCQMCRVG